MLQARWTCCPIDVSPQNQPFPLPVHLNQEGQTLLFFALCWYIDLQTLAQVLVLLRNPLFGAKIQISASQPLSWSHVVLYIEMVSSQHT